MHDHVGRPDVDVAPEAPHGRCRVVVTRVHGEEERLEVEALAAKPIRRDAMNEAARRHQPVDGTSAPVEVLAVPRRVSVGKVREVPGKGEGMRVGRKVGRRVGR